jgi:HAD superfamily hydrolase (TIGR01509 family)
VTPTASPQPGGLRAVVFDMDGVLIDTEPVWRRVETEVFASVGVALSDADCRETMGVRISDAVRMWHARQPWQGPSVEEVAARIITGVVDHVHRHGEPMDGVVAALAAVRDAGMRCAVASSSPTQLITAVIERLRIAAHVDVVCSAEDEPQGKPSPDVYLRAASLLGLHPASCVAVEDSVNGVLAARAAGMAVVVIPDDVTAADPRLQKAALRLSSLRELDAACLASLRDRYLL